MYDVTITDRDAAKNARHWYATRWVAVSSDMGTPLPHDLPISRRRLQDILFAAGRAETEEAMRHD